MIADDCGRGGGVWWRVRACVRAFVGAFSRARVRRCLIACAHARVCVCEFARVCLCVCVCLETPKLFYSDAYIFIRSGYKVHAFLISLPEL